MKIDERKTRMTPLKAIALVGLVFGSCVVCAVIFYRSLQTHTVVMVIPNGYRGPIKLVLDEQNGVNIERSNTGEYRLLIPDSGILRLRNFKLLQSWHYNVAEYRDGTVAHAVDNRDGRPVGASTVALRGGGYLAEGDGHGGLQNEHILYFVGTEAEFIAWGTVQAQRNRTPQPEDEVAND